MTRILDRLRVVLRPADLPADADLLRHYVETRDGEAFAALVRRHGPMVWGVCRRVLRLHADAEDAFQATFLVLSRKAAAVRPASALANWLHGVAYRTAMEARRAMAVRLKKERRAAELATTPEPHDPDLHEALDREIAALPERYRVAMVVCDLEGLTRKEAAARLGWSEGEVAGQLTRGRLLLARRLSRCGLSLPVAGLAGSSAVASVPRELVQSTVRIATLTNQGAASAAPAHLTCLTEGVMKTMLLTKLKAVAASLVLGCAVLATAVGVWQANATGAARAEPAEGRQKASRDTDKDRIAELERERDQLKKEVAELKSRLDQVLEAQKAAERRTVLEIYQRAVQQAQREGMEGFRPGPAPLPGTDVKPGYSGPGRDSKPGPLNPTSAVKPEDIVATKTEVRVYPADGLAASEKEAEALIRVVQKTVEPKTWQATGGEGVVEYLPGKKALVVRHTPAVHEKVAELLKLLQKPADPAKPTK